jgi:hypothetical protein
VGLDTAGQQVADDRGNSQTLCKEAKDQGHSQAAGKCQNDGEIMHRRCSNVCKSTLGRFLVTIVHQLSLLTVALRCGHIGLQKTRPS